MVHQYTWKLELIYILLNKIQRQVIKNTYVEILRSLLSIAGGFLGNCILVLVGMLSAALDFHLYMYLHIKWCSFHHHY